MSSEKDFQKLNEIFEQARKAEFSASPYLTTRILARLGEDRRTRRQLWAWRALAGGAFAFGALALILNLRTMSVTAPVADRALVAQAYVIHVDFDPAEVASVENVEVILPDGVRFYSKARAEELKNLRSLRLPLGETLAGRNKLPFVVQSDVIGSKALTVRLFDKDDRLIRERQLTVQFAGEGKTVTL